MVLFFLYFPTKVAGATLIVARENPRLPALNDEDDDVTELDDDDVDDGDDDDGDTDCHRSPGYGIHLMSVPEGNS